MHAKFIKHGVVGDEKYAKISSDRMYLHSYEIKIFDYYFKAELDNSFAKVGFEIKKFRFLKPFKKKFCIMQGLI